MDVVLGPYRLGARLGEGGMGEVRAATHVRWGHPLAIKLARASMGGTPAARAFADEIRAVAALDHPHVVRIYDQGVVTDAASGLPAGAPWLAMERARGALELPDDWDTLRRALAEVLDALGAAHAQGILHLDVKPSNVLVREDGSHALADFGIVVLRGALGREPGSPTWGSPPFMAPERFDGRPERLLEATDLYAVGCLAFHLAHRAPPFACPTWERAANAHRSEPPPVLVPRVPVPPGFAGWVRTLLAKRPGERFQTAADARHALLGLGAPFDARAVDSGAVIGPTLTAQAPGHAVPLHELLVTGRPPALAPFPERWELPSRPRRLESVGLGLLGLLAVPFVGREEARAVLWDALRSHEPELVVIGGPRGVGRTRLADEFAAAAARASATVLRIGADGVPGALRVATGVAEGLDPARSREAVALRIGRPVDDPVVARIVEGSTDALVEYVRVSAAHRRVVVVIDDVQDPELVERLRAEPALVVVTTPDPARLGGRALLLDPLDTKTARQLLADWVGLDPELVADLAERCEGDLGLALDIVRDGVRTGRLVQGPRGLEAAGDEPLPLPDAALAAWRAELPAITPELERAAVFGATVLREPLARAVGDPALVEALERDVLARGLGTPVPGGWRWPSPALRACVLADAGERLAGHHLACAAVTEDRWARGLHLLDAGRVREALTDLFHVAMDVIASGGMAVAQRRLTQVEAAMRSSVPESDAAWGHLWRCYGMLGPTHLGWTRCREYNERIVVAARRYPHDPSWREARMNAVGGLGWLLSVQLLPKEAKPWLDEEAALCAEQGIRGANWLDRMGWWALTVGDADLAVRCFTEAVEVATARGKRHMRYVADAAIGVAKRHRGDPDAVEHLEKAGAAMLEAGYLSARADLAAALGDAERVRGNLEKAEQHYVEALRATAEGEARADPGFRVGYALLLRDQGRLDRAWTELDTARRTLTDEGPTWTALIDLHLAAIAARRGDADACDPVPAAVDALLEAGFVDRDLAESASFLAGRAAADGHTVAAERAAALWRSLDLRLRPDKIADV